MDGRLMIASIDVLLTRWARWAISSESRAVGYPSTSPMFRDSPSSGVFGSSEPFGLSCGDFKSVTHAVDFLPAILKVCVIEYYMRKSGAEQAAINLGIKKSMMFKYLHSAHEKIDGFLQTRSDI